MFFKFGAKNSSVLCYRFLKTRLEFRLRRVRVNAIPPNYYLFMTKRCNLTCDFCHYHGELDPLGKVEIDHEFELKDLKAFEAKGIISSPAKVCLYGGEPMLNDDFFDCVRYLNNKGYLSSSITNGSYLKKYLQDLIDNPLHQMTVSYYEGIGNRFGTELKEISKQTLINISYIIANEDYEKLEAVVIFAIDSNAHFITVENIIEKKSSERKPVISSIDYNNYKNYILKKYSSRIIFRWSEVGKEGLDLSKKSIECSEPWDMILLNKKGRTLPCCQYQLSDFKGSSVNVEDVFNTPELMQIREKMKKNEVPSKCEGCHYLYAKDPLYNFRIK